jgi:hypothetical protein
MIGDGCKLLFFACLLGFGVNWQRQSKRARSRAEADDDNASDDSGVETISNLE